MTEGFGTVEVQVGYWESFSLLDPGDFAGGRVRFEGNLVHKVDTAYEILRLYRCPGGFRVHLNDDLPENEDGGYALYPRRGGQPPDGYGYYTQGELAEKWPELARAAGIGDAG